jgi:hypothetical protein
VLGTPGEFQIGEKANELLPEVSGYLFFWKIYFEGENLIHKYIKE